MLFYTKLVFVFGFYGCILFGTNAKSSPQTKEKSGPFTSTLIRAEKCKNPTRPYQKELPADVTLQLYKSNNNKMLLRGNYTSYKPDPTLTLSIQDYFLVNEEWQLTFRIAKMSCRGRVVSMMGYIFGIKFNKKTCAIPKGTYVFNNIDYDIVDHVFLMTRDYGRILRMVEVVGKKGTVVCLELEIVVTAESS